MRPRLDALVFSSVWVALAAASLTLASARALCGAPVWLATGLAFAGTLVVYNVDRLRDLPRDRATAPLRSAFVTAHSRALHALVAAAGSLALVLGLLAGLRAWLLLAAVLVLGLAHRRLKTFGYAKPFYIAAAWVTVTVGLPAVLCGASSGVVWVGTCVGLTILGNVIACNVRDGEAVTASLGARVPLRLARLCALGGALVCVAAPPALRPLGVVPLATLVALLPFHPGERYGHWVVDGALLLGAAGSLLLL